MYYGDEIGMGDNIYLGDRNGVRTPMQWNSDRNAGFSKCDPARLYFPVIMDPIYGYQVVNVEAQQADQSSLLHWTRNMIALRKLFQVFGRGTLDLPHPENRKILAYIRRLNAPLTTATTTPNSGRGDSCASPICRASPSPSRSISPHSPACFQSRCSAMSPSLPSPATPYPLTVAPYSSLWFELQPAPLEVPADSPANVQADSDSEQLALALASSGWSAFASGAGLELLQSTLPAWLSRQRWFGAKTRAIDSVAILDSVTIPTVGDPLGCAIFFLRIHYAEGEADTYQLPLALSTGRDETIPPASILATLTTASGPAILHDATAREDFRQALLTLIQTNASIEVDKLTVPDGSSSPGTLAASRSSIFAEIRGDQPLPARTGSAEQSNTSILFDAKLILKLFRRLQPGENPDVEIGRFLTEVAHFPRIAPFLGQINLASASGETTAVAMLQQLVPNEGDGWAWTLEDLARFYESIATCPPPTDEGEAATFLSPGRIAEEAGQRAGLYLHAAALLGRRTAEMHLALATPTSDSAFAPEPISVASLASDARRIDAQINRTLDAVKTRMSTLKDETADAAATLLSRRIELFSRAHAITSTTPSGLATRIHGDYHLGQILRSRNDFVLLDFEGEPARSLAERRAKQCPLKDVAGMLRSFSYAAWSALDQYTQRHPDRTRTLEPWLRLWQNAVSASFLNAYRDTCATRPGLLPEPAQADALLNAYLLEKALYELLYELNNRPTWVRIPLAGLL